MTVLPKQIMENSLKHEIEELMSLESPDDKLQVLKKIELTCQMLRVTYADLTVDEARRALKD